MTEAQALETMTQRWIDAWVPLRPTVPYTFEGEPFDSVDAWARVTFVHTVRRQVTMGSDGARKFESRGTIFVQLFGPPNQGVKLLAELADDVRKVFEGRRLATELTTYAGSSREVPTDGRWLQKSVTIPFLYEAIG